MTFVECLLRRSLSAVLLVGLKPRNISKKYSGPFEGFHDSFCWSFQSFRIQSFLWSPFRARGHSPSWSRPSASYINHGNLFSCDEPFFFVNPASSIGKYVGSKKLFFTSSRVRISELDSLCVPFFVFLCPFFVPLPEILVIFRVMAQRTGKNRAKLSARKIWTQSFSRFSG